jgi:hypothetical protein
MEKYENLIEKDKNFTNIQFQNYIIPKMTTPDKARVRQFLPQKTYLRYYANI